jgi:hypothetical protein
MQSEMNTVLFEMHLDKLCNVCEVSGFHNRFTKTPVLSAYETLISFQTMLAHRLNEVQK